MEDREKEGETRAREEALLRDEVMKLEVIGRRKI